ncbi:Gfo/Idh/MocA family oxidoreductase [Geodermatophilus sp. SYSU D01045]
MTDPSGAFTWGVFGTGDVAHRFVAGLRGSSTPTRVGRVASRDPARAAAFAGSVGARPDTYAGIVRAGDVDAVYVATPAPVHEEHALMCLRAGIPVLVEKPFSTDAASARRIADAAREHRVFAMEAMWTRFVPLLGEVRRIVAAGEIGEPRAFRGSFAAPDPSPSSSNRDPRRGGGALLQRGVYPLSLACHLLGEVTEISGLTRPGPSGVDEDVVAGARHRGGAVSQWYASLVTGLPNDMTVLGTAGRIDVAGPLFRPSSLRVTPYPGPRSGARRLPAGWQDSHVLHQVAQRTAPLRRALGRRGRAVTRPYTANGYTHEAEAVVSAIGEGLLEHPLMPLSESVHVVELMDRLRTGRTSREGVA